ncbi:lantibiotic dehydratase [Actinokineospora auranticolor]|uniref:Uncharacterized protein n=1 Tax=Actinokineospora auranticolor TaxID=155976 RepID=A0A2S6GPH1_9PSEU|nr:lantibiotic dehydratase [Actinokineospora auranticolor]PPK67097.1 hypothetical protein CLV40_10894 [Actinokineospora auranticolor]
MTRPGPTRAPSPTPDAARPPDGSPRQWRLGREFVLRHAGFPFDWLVDLGADEDLIRLADEVVDHEQRLSEAQRGSAAVHRGKAEQLPATPAVRAWAEAFARFAERYADADAEAGRGLGRVLDRPEVGEAVLLSNPDAYHNMLCPLRAHDGPLTSKWRRVRRQMYTYVQRLCAKNETVSFFGPMAYGSVGERRDLVVDRPRTRRVFCAHWAAKAIATAIARDPKILPDLRFHPTGRPGEHSELLAVVPPGGATFRAIRAAAGLRAAEVAKGLAVLVAEQRVCVAFGPAEYDDAPLTTMLDQLAALPASAARDSWVERVAGFEQVLTDLAEADLAGRITLVATAEQRFTELTGKPARRGAGAAYADRAVFFEECSSPFALTVDADLVAGWEKRLHTALEACVGHGAATQRSAVAAVRRDHPDGESNLLDYAARAAAALADATSTQQAGHAPVHLPSEVDDMVAGAARAPGDRYAVVDLCPAAASVDGFDTAGLVLSRVHHHLLVDSWLATMHPDRTAFGADAAAWVAEQRGAVVGLDFGRRNKGYYRFPGPEVAMRPLTWADLPDGGPMRPWDLRVSVAEDGVRLSTPDGAGVRAYVSLSDFVKYPPMAALAHPQVLHPAFATDAEVVVGDVVLQRARRRVPTRGFTAPEPHVRFLHLRRVARELGCRFVFCRGAHERKPYLLDLASPLAADLVGHVARGADTLTVEPMAPGPDHLWLRDEQGHRYTSELRVQVIGTESGGTP